MTREVAGSARAQVSTSFYLNNQVLASVVHCLGDLSIGGEELVVRPCLNALVCLGVSKELPCAELELAAL